MKKAEKAQKTAELPQQKLPGESTVTAGSGSASAANTSADLEKLALSAIDRPQSEPSISGPLAGADDARLVTVERTHDLVATHALRLKQSGDDSLRVVIDPGGGTRLSLELRFTNGTIEAQALLHRGDFQFLSSHWSELQQRLEPRGVHLGALACSDASTEGQEPFHQSRHQAAQEQPSRSAFAEFALDGPMADMPAARRTRPKTDAGWETWA